MTTNTEQSRWLKHRVGYRLPNGNDVYLANGPMLWLYRNSEQRKAADDARRAQEKRQEEAEDARPA